MLSLLACAVLSVDRLHVLVFTKTAGFRHDSIPTAVAEIGKMAIEKGFDVTFTEDANWFSKEGLSRSHVVAFVNTTGDVLNKNQEEAFQSFVEQGGGFIGVHAAADTEYDWPWYGTCVGAYFKGHPHVQPAEVKIEAPSHATMSHLPSVWKRTDEWYNYRENPRPKVQVLATLDETTYEGGVMGKDHPIVWCHEVGKGRAWYTGMGHTAETFSEPLFREKLWRAIQWTARKLN